MNNIIQKCVDELGKEAPRLDYLRGMLESLLVMNAPSLPTFSMPAKTEGKVVPPEELSDEQTELVDKYAKGPIGKINT